MAARESSAANGAWQRAACDRSAVTTDSAGYQVSLPIQQTRQGRRSAVIDFKLTTRDRSQILKKQTSTFQIASLHLTRHLVRLNWTNLHQRPRPMQTVTCQIVSCDS